MMRATIAILAVLSIAGTALAQEEDDPFATADDPFATADDPFAALEANVTEAETTLGAAVQEATSATTATEEKETAPAPTPAPAAAPDPAAAKPDDGASKDTPGLGIVALLGALALVAIAIKRNR